MCLSRTPWPCQPKVLLAVPHPSAEPPWLLALAGCLTPPVPLTAVQGSSYLTAHLRLPVAAAGCPQRFAVPSLLMSIVCHNSVMDIDHRRM